MILARLVAVVLLLYLAASYAGIVRSSVHLLRTFLPRLHTLGQMSVYKEGLKGYWERFGDLPPDLYEWLNEYYATLPRRNPGKDEFGTPFIVHFDGAPLLRSSGTDRIPFTGDDLVIVLLGKE